jgi:FAD-dependent oxidoreductase domain-containing protein 1
MVTNGYLLMFGPEHAEEQYRALENHKDVKLEQKILKVQNYLKFFHI